MRRRNSGWSKQHGFSDLVSLVKSGKAYVKISISGGPRENYGHFTPLAQTLISANVDRVLWGSSWPHPNGTNGSTSKVRRYGRSTTALCSISYRAGRRDSAVRQRILVDNPVRLYEF
jgi:predicted TIM-barrel fold metal-dependent hydrolase